MSSVDKLKLLAGLPIPMSDFTCILYPATLKEIALMGVDQFFRYVNLLTIKKEEVFRMMKQEIDSFDFLFVNAVYKEEFKNELLNALKFFTRDEIIVLPEMECFVIGNFEDSKFLDRNNFPEFQKILRAQNFIEEEIVEYTGEDEVARMIKDKLEKGKKQVEKIKSQKDGSPVEMADLIGSLATNSTIDIYNIWNLSYYSFNDQFKRMRLLEQYNTGLQSIMAGADPKKIKLQDWIQNISIQ